MRKCIELGRSSLSTNPFKTILKKTCYFQECNYNKYVTEASLLASIVDFANDYAYHALHIYQKKEVTILVNLVNDTFHVEVVVKHVLRAPWDKPKISL